MSDTLAIPPVLPPFDNLPGPLTLRRARLACGPAGLVGATPLLWIDRPFAPPGRGFWAKLEAANPGGLKDRAALHVVARARQAGVLAPGGLIVESSSGTYALGLALAGVVFGHPVAIVTDPGLETGMVRLLSAYGATIDTVTERHPVGGWQQARRERVAAILAAQPAWCPDQYANPDTIAAYAPLGAELAAQLGRVDVLVAAVGTGGHSAGVIAELRRRTPRTRLVGVDTIGSVLFGQPDAPRLMRGLGSSVLPANLRRELFDEVHWVAPGEAVWAARRLAGTCCVTGGWSVGAVALVAGWLARTLPAGVRIAAIFPDGAHRYVSTVFDDGYCGERGLLDVVPAAHPQEFTQPGQAVATRWTRCRLNRSSW